MRLVGFGRETLPWALRLREGMKHIQRHRDREQRHRHSRHSRHRDREQRHRHSTHRDRETETQRHKDTQTEGCDVTLAMLSRESVIS